MAARRAALTASMLWETVRQEREARRGATAAVDVPGVGEAGGLDVGAHTHSLRREALENLLLQEVFQIGGDVGQMGENFVGLNDGELEGLVGLAKVARQRPGDLFVEVLELDVSHLGDVAEQRVHSFGLGVFLVGLDDVLGRDAALREVDVALLLVDAQHDDKLDAADANQFRDRADATARQFGQQNHAYKECVVCERGEKSFFFFFFFSSSLHFLSLSVLFRFLLSFSRFLPSISLYSSNDT